jgi:putative addiction module killer protein
MKRVFRSVVYRKWIKNLRDSRAKARVFDRIDRLANGNHGDTKPVGDGCSELRIDYGPGYRIYYKETGKEIILLLCGGDKTTQDADIARAIKIAKDFNAYYEEEK